MPQEKKLVSPNFKIYKLYGTSQLALHMCLLSDLTYPKVCDPKNVK